ncbi:MAG TPA: hypothetical protein VFO52_02345 [Longimicrobiales bacterium]|nr:hypothetical protein [Longimicrobiales bacterium]
MKARLPILLLLLSASDLQAQRHPQAETLVSAWIDAAGGASVWDGVRDLRYTITTIWYDSTGHELRRRPRYVWIKKLAGGFRVRVERTEAEGRYLQIWNNGARASLNGVWLPDTARAVSEVQYVAAELTYWIGLPWKLRDPGVQLSYLELDHTPVVHVHFGSGVGLHDGDRFWYYWRDAGSPFPTEVHYVEEGLSEVDRKVLLLREPTRLGPGVFFARRTMQNARGLAARDLLISDVVVNRGMRDSLFR